MYNLYMQMLSFKKTFCCWLQGNHGEDCKELYYYLDSSPTHSYMKALYKYPRDGYPYQTLVEGNIARGVDQLEFEVEDTGIIKVSWKYHAHIYYRSNIAKIGLLYLEKYAFTDKI